uniref:Uncharacterized protein n=1 Tax=Bionectria ochroleuca TaxID=29856 RepID=A0A8H7NFD7_BIOOC
MSTPRPHRPVFPSCLDPSRPPAATDPISLAFTPLTSQSSFLKLQATGRTTGICSIHHSTAALFMHLLVPLTDYFALRFSFLIQHGHGVAPLYRLVPRAYPLDAHWTMDGSQMGPLLPTSREAPTCFLVQSKHLHPIGHALALEDHLDKPSLARSGRRRRWLVVIWRTNHSG